MCYIAMRQPIENIWPKYSANNNELRHYFNQKDQITIKHSSGGRFIIFRGDQVVLPTSLHRPIMELVHEGHMGSTKMKSILYAYMYWCGMSKSIEDFVRLCPACTAFQKNYDKKPFISVADQMTKPWTKIDINITGPSWMALDFSPLLTTTADILSPSRFVGPTPTTLYAAYVGLFSTLGLQEEIASDNGTIFCSQDFKVFPKSNGIRHSQSAVYYPQSNGLIKQFHSTLKSRIKRIWYAKNWPLDICIDKVLYDYPINAK